MERFIGDSDYYCEYAIDNLKSNMDRFIVKEKAEKQVVDVHLKSNMDRFIVCNIT